MDLLQALCEHERCADVARDLVCRNKSLLPTNVLSCRPDYDALTP